MHVLMLSCMLGAGWTDKLRQAHRRRRLSPHCYDDCVLDTAQQEPKNSWTLGLRMLLGTYHQERIRNVIKGMQENLRILNIYVVKSLSHVQLFATPWTVAYQAPLSIRFSRQEYCSTSQLRDRTQVSHVAGRRFIIWATREEPDIYIVGKKKPARICNKKCIIHHNHSHK